MAGTQTGRTGDFPEEGIKAPCVVSLGTNLTLSGEQTIGSTAVVAGDRVLARGQTLPAENGIWVCAIGAWTRPSDWSDGNDVSSGMLVTDAANAQIYIATFTGTFVAGTTEVTIAVMSISGAGTLAGNNTWTGNNTWEGTGRFENDVTFISLTPGAKTVTFSDVKVEMGDSGGHLVSSYGVEETFYEGITFGRQSSPSSPSTTNTGHITKTTSGSNLIISTDNDNSADIALTPDATQRVEVTQGAFKLPPVQNVAAITFTPENGDCVYNTDGLLPMVYANGAWEYFDGTAPVA